MTELPWSVVCLIPLIGAAAIFVITALLDDWTMRR